MKSTGEPPVLRLILAMLAIAKGFVGFYVSRFRRNYPGYVREFLPYLCLSVLAAFLDLVTTWRFMHAGSVYDEFHPVIRSVSILAGPLLGPLIGKLGQLLALLFVTIVFREAARIIFIPVILIYLYAAWYNTWGVHLYTPLFLRLFAG
jgi:hypothetical protein